MANRKRADLLMHHKAPFSLLLYLPFAAVLAAVAFPVEAQRGEGRPGLAERRDSEVKATGLAPVFPQDHLCPAISSPFGSPYRYDGSRRPDDRHRGLHGGMDITLKEGTPLLAVAKGTVIAKGEGGQMEGVFLWLKHSPSDTGLSFWVFTKYQHLSELPALNEGDGVEAGQAIALSGKTGTVGGHYGRAGYPHLHLTVSIGRNEEYTRAGAFGSMIRARGARISDPLILYLTNLEDPATVAARPDEAKRVRIPVISDDGSLHPPGSKVVWPVRCRYKGKM